jgi:hypothetical protein
MPINKVGDGSGYWITNEGIHQKPLAIGGYAPALPLPSPLAVSVGAIATPLLLVVAVNELSKFLLPGPALRRSPEPR